MAALAGQPPDFFFGNDSRQSLISRLRLSAGDSVFDRVISHFRVHGFPPFRQEKGKRRGTEQVLKQAVMDPGLDLPSRNIRLRLQGLGGQFIGPAQAGKHRGP